MDETVQVEVDQSQYYVVGNIELNVVGHWPGGTFQELTETLVTQFHQENGQAGLRVTICTKIRHHIGVTGRAKETTFFLKPLQVGDSSGVTEVKERGVHDLGSTGETVTLGLTHPSIGASSQSVFLEELNNKKSKLIVPGSHDYNTTTINLLLQGNNSVYASTNLLSWQTVFSRLSLGCPAHIRMCCLGS